MKKLKVQTIKLDVIERYLDAKRFVIENGFSKEIEWQDGLDIQLITEAEFLRETAWVILSSGMRESVIRAKFPEISNAFHDWKCSKLIRRRKTSCSKNALRVFGHKQKIAAIVSAASLVAKNGISEIKENISSIGISYLEQIPYIGTTTKFHLAKNIGVDVVKPDRHLCRIAECLGYFSPSHLCDDVRKITGDKVSVVDLVFWRYATLDSDYLSFFSLNRKQALCNAA